MKKPVKIVIHVFLFSMALLVIAVNALTPGMPEVTEADLALPLQMEDGTVVTLGEVIRRDQAAEAALRTRAAAPRREPKAVRIARAVDILHGQGVFGLGLRRLAQGKPEEALTIWRAIPNEHRDYARAQRFIGYKIYDRALGEPAKGVAYVNRSIWNDPLSGNAWQDAARIYLHAALDAFR